MIVHVVKAAVTDLTVDAVVNPANSQGLMDHGIAKALREQGGQEIEDEARSLAPIAIGAAVVTKGGRLWARQVIHAPTLEEPATKSLTPVKIGVENVRRATRAALLAASRLQIVSLALPGMGTGAGGVEPNEAARAMVDEIRAHRMPHPQTIYLSDLKDDMVAAFEEALRASNG
jgi:O-acetyl-ADP-ribose deacetylase (regulator of RNase III)